MGNQYNSGYDYSPKQRIERVKNNLKKNAPELEYAKGFTYCDGRIIAKYRECGHEFSFSLVNLRHKEYPKRCPECDETLTEEQKSKIITRLKVAQFKEETKKIDYEQMKLKQCPQCKSFFFGFDDLECCSKECYEQKRKQYINHYKETKKRKSRTKDSRHITLQELYIRDKGICWICGGKVNMNLDHNDEMYGSIDHVIPISKGGMDSWDNVKLAHRRCNRIKSNKIDIVVVREMISFISPSI